MAPRRSRSVWTGFSAVLLLAGVPACGDDDATNEQPPWCLGDVDVPDDEAAIEAVFAAMPAEIDGEPKRLVPSDARLELFYEEAIEGTPSVMAVDISSLAQPGGEPMNGLRYMEIVGDLAEDEEDVDPGGVTGTVDQASLDPSAGLVWGVGTTIEVGATPDADVVAPSMMFAEPDSGWVFTLTASTDEMLSELVDAFCDATS